MSVSTGPTGGPPPRIVRFGVFDFDLDSHALSKNGIRVRIQDQPAAILATLLSHAGQVVSRDELRQMLWPDGTFVDFDQGLNKAVNKLRETLGDSAGTPRYVETVPRRGYMFIAPVIAQHDPTPPLPAPHVPRQRDLSRGRVAVAVTCALVAALAFILFSARRPSLRVVGSRQISRDGNRKHFSVATDGSRVYFAAREAGRLVLCELPVSGGEIRRIPTPFAGQHHVVVFDVSAATKELLVGSFELGGQDADSMLWTLPLTGGSARRLGELRGQDAGWSPDGQKIVLARRDRIHVASTAGHELAEIAKMTGRTIWRPRWSPDGSRIRFSAWDSIPERLAIWEVAATGGNPRRLFPSWQETHGGGSWTADGKHFVFESRHDLWGIREDPSILQFRESRPVQLTFGPISYWPPAPSADGSTLYGKGDTPRGALLRYDVEFHAFRPYLADISADSIDFSDLGDWLCYTSYPGSELWRRKMNGSEKLKLTSSPLRSYGPQWSPDGSQIAFAGKIPGKPWKVYVVPSAGGTVREVSPANATAFDPTWSHDGKELAFAPLPDAPEPHQIYIFHVGTSTATMLPGSAGLFSPRWSPAANMLAALTEKGHKLMLFSKASRTWMLLADGPADSPAWSRDGKYIYFQGVSHQADGANRSLMRVAIDTRKVEYVADWNELQLLLWTGIAPDGGPLVIQDVGGQEIYALNWEGE
jgi:Tol biopolymer transport system component/DNA-binding winged helix-turn-helix (wHTH) protein